MRNARQGTNCPPYLISAIFGTTVVCGLIYTVAMLLSEVGVDKMGAALGTVGGLFFPDGNDTTKTTVGGVSLLLMALFLIICAAKLAPYCRRQEAVEGEAGQNLLPGVRNG